jgi:hypothetical protein
LKPGFGSYFDRWFDRQEELWREENTGIDRHEVDRVLSVLAFALGALETADLLALMKHIHETQEIIAANRLLEPLRRFVFGNGKRGSGYVLSHPKIGEYLQEERFAASKDVLCRGFAACGKGHLGDLNEGKIEPEQASSYALQYLPEHLEKVGACPQDYMMMVDDGWRRAWEKLEGGQRGFASSVQKVWDSQRRNRTDLRLGAQWRCALALSSINSLGANLPGQLILTAAERGVLNPRQAAYFAEIKGPSEESVTLLAGLAIAVRDNQPLRAELALSALATARMAREDARAVLLSMAIGVLYSVEPHLAPDELGDAFAATKVIGNEDDRSRALAALAPHLTPGQLSEALLVASAISSESYRSSALAALAPHLSQEQLGEALAAARAIIDERFRPYALAALAPNLPPEQRHEVLGEALAAAKAGDEGARSQVLTARAPHLSAEQLSEALTAAKAIRGEDSRITALAALAPHLPPEQRRDALGEELAAAKTISEGLNRFDYPFFSSSRSSALAALAPHLSQEQLAEALAAAKAIGNVAERSRVLAALAPHLPPEQRRDALGEALAAALSHYQLEHATNLLAC